MRTEDVEAAVEHIRSIADRDAAAHIAEDRLHKSVLQSIADGTAEDPRAMAAAALRTGDIHFDRWYE